RIRNRRHVDVLQRRDRYDATSRIIASDTAHQAMIFYSPPRTKLGDGLAAYLPARSHKVRRYMTFYSFLRMRASDNRPVLLTKVTRCPPLLGWVEGSCLHHW